MIHVAIAVVIVFAVVFAVVVYDVWVNTPIGEGCEPPPQPLRQPRCRQHCKHPINE